MLLRRMAKNREVTAQPEHRYDHSRQVSQVRLEDGSWVDSWEADVLQRTKKGDIETGEDQKGV